MTVANPSRTGALQSIASIKSVGKRELMGEARIGMRTIDAVWAGQDVSDEDLKRMADAAGGIVSRKQKRDKRVAAVAWLETKREEMRLTALAKMLRVDAANLWEGDQGREKLPTTNRRNN